MKTNTLSFRLFFFTSLWMLFSLAIVALLVSQDYRRTVEKQFENLITANLYNLMGSIKRGEDGALSGVPQLGDSRYKQFHSGWYWTVNSVGSETPALSSSSLVDLKLPTPKNTNFDTNFQRSYRVKDGAGNNLMTVEAKVFLGEGNDLYAFRTTGNLAVLDEGISRFQRRLIFLLGIFGIGLIVTSFAIVRFGLKPLRHATNQLAQIREGKAQRIEGEYPQEIAPLIEETNALIKSNQSIVERSRTQVGNLAHSLKTPLSVLSLEVKNLPKPIAGKVRKQLDAMGDQIQTYLNRAMISARHGAITSRSNVNQVLNTMVRTFNKINPDISYVLKQASGNDIIFAGEKPDLEEVIGNLLENAGKFARKEVLISLGSLKANGMVEIEISDDGPGLSDTETEFVIKRGNRLDEATPGTGLGLSIVSDILKEYGGSMKLSSESGQGLKVVLQLPCV